MKRNGTEIEFMIVRIGKFSAELSRKSFADSMRFVRQISYYIQSCEIAFSSRGRKKSTREKKKREKEADNETKIGQGSTLDKAPDAKTFNRSAIIFVHASIELNYPRTDAEPVIFHEKKIFHGSI